MNLTEETLLRVRDGSMSFDALARATRPEFTALATKVVRVYGSKLKLDLDDVVQEMLIEVYRQIERWDPARGYAIKRWVVWHACTRGREFCKDQFRTTAHEVDPEVQVGQIQDAYQELEIQVVEKLRDIPQGPRQIAVLNSVVDTLSIDQSVEELLRNPRTRAMFAGDRQSVRRGICRTVRELTRRAQAMG